MSTNILADIAPKLGEQIASATEQQRRAASVAACRWAIERTGIHEPIVDTALARLNTGVVNDTPLAARLEKLAQDYDSQYFAAEERYLGGQGDKETFLALADKARVTYAVFYAFNEDRFKAATWSIYEACAAIRTDGAVKEVEASVDKALHDAKGTAAPAIGRCRHVHIPRAPRGALCV